MSTVVATSDPTPSALATLAALAEAGDMRAFTAAREAQLRGDQPPAAPAADPATPTGETPAATPADQPAAGDPPATPPQTDEEKAAAAEAAKATEAGKALAEAKNRGEKRKQTLREEIDHLRWQKGEEERRIAALREEAQRLQNAPPPAKPEEKAFDPGPEPKEEDFADYRDFVKATAARAAKVAAHDAETAALKAFDERREAEQRQFAERQQAQADQQLRNDANARAAEFAKANPDFYETMDATVEDPEFVVPPTMQVHILHSPLGPAVAYHLAKDRAEFRRIAALAPGPMLVAIGRLEAKLDTPQASHPSGPTPVRKPVDPAARPVSPVGSSATVTAVPSQELVERDPSAWMKQRDADERRRRSGR